MPEGSLPGLLDRLRARRSEIEQAALARAYAVAEPARQGPLYAEGLRDAVASAIDYAFAGVERGDAPPVPAPLLAQARLAAVNGVSLDTVLRRYLAGYLLLGDLLVEEAQEGGLHGSQLKRQLRTQAALFDRLIAAVSDEHARASQGSRGSGEWRRGEQVQQLLDGELVDTAGFEYDFRAHHLGLVCAGPGAANASRKLAAALDRRLLLVQRGEGLAWAWLGGARRTDPEQARRLVVRLWPERGGVAIGEPARGFSGWRLSHRQAMAALAVALRSQQRLSRYGDVVTLAAALGDELFVTSLRELYLVPLAQGRDGGEVLKTTLRAYFAAERNVSSAASALKVSRQTVANRLQLVEDCLQRTLARCGAELETALLLEELDRDSSVSGAPE